MDCKKSFHFGGDRKKRELVKRHLEDKSSYRDIERRNGCSKNTAMEAVHEVSKIVKDSSWIASHFKPKWRGVLVLDGTYISVKDWFAHIKFKGKDPDEKFLHKMVALLGTDYHTRDLPHYSLGDNENMVDLVLYFQYLKNNGYDLQVLVRDGNERITKAAEIVYSRPIVTQLCHKHFIAKMEVIEASKEHIFERDKVSELKSRIWFIIRAHTIEESIGRMDEFLLIQKFFQTSEVMEYLVNRFIRDFEELTTYLQYPKGFVPSTSNVAENMNGQLKARFKSMKGFKTIQSAENYLKLWCLKRRFQKFTDCRKPHTHLNGKSPLEIAGCKIAKIDYLKL